MATNMFSSSKQTGLAGKAKTQPGKSTRPDERQLRQLEGLEKPAPGAGGGRLGQIADVEKGLEAKQTADYQRRQKMVRWLGRGKSD